MSLLIGCSCASGNGNTGLPSCVEALKVARGLGVINAIANDGTENRIDISVDTLGTVVSDLLVNADISKRLLPITDLRNVDFPKEDTQYETDNANQKAFVRDGIQSFTAEKWEVPAGFDLKLKQMRCPSNTTYLFTRRGMVGIKKLDSTDGKYYLYGIKMQAFAPDFVMPTATTVAKEMIAFDFDATVEKGELWEIPYSELGVTYDELVGLLDVNYETIDAVTGGGTTSVGLRITTDYGSGLMNNQTVDGLVTGDFVVTDLTTSLAVAGLAVTEVVDDKYTISWTSETSADVIEIKLDLATGFEGSTTVIEP